MIDYKVKVIVNFTTMTKYGSFSDNLYFSEDEYTSLTNLNNLMQQRVDNWIAYCDNPPAPVELTKDDLQAQLDQTVSNLTDVVTKIAPLQTDDELRASLAVVQVKGQELATILESAMGS